MAKMDEEMITLHNVMSLELAIKRELEYRRKMEVLKRQHRSDHPLVSLEVPPPSQADRKRKEPAIVIQPSSSYQLFQNHPAGLACDACQLAFGTLFHLKQHCESLKHRGILFEQKKRGGAASNPFRCRLCNSWCSSGLTLGQHLNGTKHAALLQDFEAARQA
ncbi:hypothetical protein RJ640_007944 [Escallonia rubra]|uniref:C2H2-type domain-containing protein n=1 Tax=Escallonia rubra TaxID=112253 RepID=A0AA88QNU4_9ASTE|nr:hypothetical protein RJ640_007944 [Escallonia rubra]